MVSIPGIDAGVRAIRAVEDSWSLPKLPEMVTLDLAAFSGLGTRALQQFVGDLENDIQQTMPAPNPTSRTYTMGQQTQRVASGIANMPLPRKVDAGGVEAFKERAVRLGYVRPESITMDSTWDPALNNVYWQMSNDDFTRAKQGNVPGPGSSIGEVMDTFDKWLSPTGLLEAATELGLFWDFEQIGNEFKKGDMTLNPLAIVGRSLNELRKGNPLEALKQGWRALGPVDDLLMPVFNVALLFSGVGQVGLFAKGVQAGAKGSKALQAVHGARYAPITSKLGSGAGRAAMETTDLAGDIDRMRRGGMLSSRIAPNASVLEASGRTVGPTRMAIGRGMQAWREIPNVMVAKKAVQKGMQLGLVSRTEQALGYEPGPSLSDIPGVQPTTQFMRGYGEPTKFSLPASIMFEAMFTPTTIINPGVVRNPFGYISNFSKVADHGFFSEEMGSAVRKQIANRIEDPDVSPAVNEATTAEALQMWDAEVKQVGTTQALANRFTGGDKEELGGWMTWMAVTSAIDAQAHSAAKLDDAINMVDDFIDEPARFKQKFHTARNSLISQLRYADPDDMPAALRTIVATDSRVKSVEDADDLLRIYMQDLFTEGSGVPGSAGRSSADDLREMIDAHNVARRQKIQELLETHMTPGIFEIAVRSKLDEMGDWDSFNRSMNLVEDEFGKGLLNQAQSKRGVNPETGRLVGKKETFLRQRTPQDVKTFPLEDSIHFDLRDVLADPEFRELAEAGKFNIFGGADDVRGKMTIARKETMSKQDKQGEYAALKTLHGLKDAANQLDTNPELASKWRQLLVRLENEFGISTNNFAGIKEADLNKVMNEIGIGADAARRIRRLRRYAIKNQVDVTQLEGHFAGRLEEIYESDRWARVHGINSTLRPDQKMKALKRQIGFTAAEVDPDSVPAGLIDALDDMGYKLVHGQEYVTPRDLTADGGKPFVEVHDLVEKQKYKDSLGFVGRRWGSHLEAAEARALKAARRLGTAGKRYTQDQVTMMYNAQLRNSLLKTLWATDGAHDFSKVDSVDMDLLIERMQDISSSIRDLNARRLEDARTTASRPGRMLPNVQSSFSPEAAPDLVRTNKMTQLLINGVSEGDSAYPFTGLKGYGYSDEEIVAVIDALKRARDVGPQLRGRLVSIQDRLQATPNLTNAMRFLSKTRVVDPTAGMLKRNYQEAAQFATKSAITAAPGGAAYGLAATQQDEDLSFFHALGFTVLGRSVANSKIGFKAQKSMLKKMGIGNSAEVMRFNEGGRGLHKWADKLDNNQKWKHYSYVADHLATMRDYMRFTLSPIFDASRYTEGMVLSQIGHIPESVQEAGGLRFNMSPTRWQKDRARQISGSKKPTPEAIRQAKTEWTEVQNEFAGIGRARNDFDFEALEATTARFRQIGILGFNTQDWMASLYADLTRIHGMEKYKAYETAKSAFTYGLNPRSAAEMNVNAVFFPFSFSKKSFGHAANFLGQDWSRAAMLHDAIKTYEFLDEHYNLSDVWRERLPLLEKAQRLNIFAYGLTPGELGGANRPYINFLKESGVDEVTVNPIMNVFLPQGHQIRNNAEAEAAFDTLSRVAPVFNDVEHLLQDAREQGHVLFGGNGLTEAAEAERGYAEVSQLNEMIDAAIKEEGGAGGISEIRRKRWSHYFDYQQAAKEAVRNRYPAYKEAVAASVGNSVLKSQEEKELIAAFENAGGLTNDSPREVKMGGLLKLSDDLIRRAGSYDQIPPEARDQFREIAASWAEDEHYLRLGWRKHLMRTWGPIESVLG